MSGYRRVGARTATSSPAHAIARTDDQPVGLTAFGYIAGAWFDASVASGESKTLSWYHITDYPESGDPAATVAEWAAQLDAS